MKGMQRIRRGSGFSGALKYVFFGDKNDSKNTKKREYVGVLIGGNMAGTNPRELTAEFKVARQLRPDIEKPVWHQSLRLPPGEKLSPDRWNEIADDYMLRMNFHDDFQYVVVLHDDPDGQHVHLLSNRISLSGNVNLGRHESMKSTAHLQQIEKDYGLTITKGPTLTADGKVEMPGVRPLKKNEIEMGVRTGDKPPRMQLQDALSQAIKDGPSIRQFVERLEAADITVIPNVTASGKMSGFAFEFNGIRFKGSDLGKAYTWNGLTQRGLDYEQTRDTAFLAELRSRRSIEPGRDASADARPAAVTIEQSKPVFQQPAQHVAATADNGVGEHVASGPIAGDEPAIKRIDVERPAPVLRELEPAPGIAHPDDRASSAEKSAVEVSTIEPRRDPVSDRKQLEVASNRKQEAHVDPTEVSQRAEQTGGLEASNRIQHSERTAERQPSVRVAQVVEAIAQLSVAERGPLIKRIIAKIRTMISSIRKREQIDELTRVQGIRGASETAFAALPRAGKSAGSGTNAESGHRAKHARQGPPPHLRGRMQRLSARHLVFNWGRDAGALFKNVSHSLVEQRPAVDKALQREERRPSSEPALKSALAPISAAPSPADAGAGPMQAHVEKTMADAAARAKAWVLQLQKKKKVIPPWENKPP